jgi:hypothetical protein
MVQYKLGSHDVKVPKLRHLDHLHKKWSFKTHHYYLIEPPEVGWAIPVASTT